jgi:HD-GYP domain-containing protein (c-di-GMP phosphodiesterase class II)
MFSVQLASTSGAFTKEALGIIADHHEAPNGTGWPRGRRDSSRGSPHPGRGEPL